VVSLVPVLHHAAGPAIVKPLRSFLAEICWFEGGEDHLLTVDPAQRTTLAACGLAMSSGQQVWRRLPRSATTSNTMPVVRPSAQSMKLCCGRRGPSGFAEPDVM